MTPAGGDAPAPLSFPLPFLSTMGVLQHSFDLKREGSLPLSAFSMASLQGFTLRLKHDCR